MSFSTAINCMDGRTQLPVNQYMQEQFGAEYVDTITEPGPVAALADRQSGPMVKSICERIDISVDKHGSSAICIVAHAKCAGNPVAAETQASQLKTACEFLKDRYRGCTVVGVWLDTDWVVKEKHRL